MATGARDSNVSKTYIISLKFDPERRKDADDLLLAVKSLPPDVEIIEGSGRCAITVKLSNKASLQAANKIEFADVEPYSELALL